MTTAPVTAWPKKAREMHNHHMDSTVWNDFDFRGDDVIVATWAKSGTTWTQQIVAQLIHHGAEDINVPMLSPWLDLRIMPKEAIEAVKQQAHRRAVKTHLPADAMVISPKASTCYSCHTSAAAKDHMVGVGGAQFGTVAQANLDVRLESCDGCHSTSSSLAPVDKAHGQ
jgi:hypothetical protein